MWRRSGSGAAPSASDEEFQSYDEEEAEDPPPIQLPPPALPRLNDVRRDMILSDDADDDSLGLKCRTAPSGVQLLNVTAGTSREGETSSACSTSGVSSSSNTLHLRTNSTTSDTATRRKRQSNDTTSSRGKGKSRAEYFFHNLIGEGALGKVFRVVRTQTGEELAIKMVKKSRILHCPALCQMVREEVRIHSREDIINHPNIVTLKSSFQDETFLYYVFECVSGGTLSKTIERLRQFRSCPVVPVEIIRMWMAELLSVVWTLARARIVHRDLKPDNVLLQDGHIRVIDFNNALIVTDAQSAVGRLRAEGARATSEGSSDRKKVSDLTADFGGTLPYWAPERVALCMSRSANRSPTFVAGSTSARSGWSGTGVCPGVELDVWGLGCILYEMLTGTNPFLRATPEMTADRIMRYSQKATTLEFPANVGPLAKDLCLRLLDPSPACRANMIPAEYDVLYSHPFFAGLTLDAPLKDFNPKTLLQSILEQAQSQTKASNVTASLLEFTPEIGRVFDGRPTNDNGPLSANWAYRESIDETSSSRAVNEPLSGASGRSIRSSAPSWSRSKSKARSAAGLRPCLQPIAAFNSDEEDETSVVSEEHTLASHQSDGDGTPRQAESANIAEKTVTSPCLRLHAYSFTRNESRPSCGSSSEILLAPTAIAKVATPAPREKMDVPLPTRVSFADESSTAASHQPVMDDWVTRMSSPDFREFMISHLIGELARLVSEEAAGAGDLEEGTGVVEAADVMTWGPLKVRLEPATPPELPSAKGRFGIVKQQCLSLEAESPGELSISSTRLSYNHVNRMAPTTSSHYLGEAEGRVPRSASGLLCCVRSPSYLMINRIRRWITPVNTPQHEETWSENSARALSGEVTVVRPVYPPSMPPPVQTNPVELICFGVLTGQLGLLLFVADVDSDECRLAYKLNLKDPQAMGSLSTVPDNPTLLRITFFPGDLPVIERETNKLLRIRAAQLNVGLPGYSANWLGPLGSILIAGDDKSNK